MRGIVQTEIAKGRRELGWEVAYSAQNGLTTKSFTAAVVLNNDADFVGKRLWLSQFRTDQPLDPRVTVQVRDGATGQVLMRQAGVLGGLCASVLMDPDGPATGLNIARFAANQIGLPAPYVIRRGSTVFFEFANANGLTIAGDIYAALEGFRVYPGETDDVPAKIQGYALPFSWNGTLAPAADASGNQVKFGTITMPGLGPGHYVLKYAQVFTTKLPSGASTITVLPDPFLGIQFYASKNQSKRLVHVNNPATTGDFMPLSFLTGGGTGFPWEYPMYLSGVDTIYADIYGVGTDWATNTPGTIELQMNGVFIPS